MTDQLDIVVIPTDDDPTAQVLAVAALLALEWAAPYAKITIGQSGEFPCRPTLDAAGGLLRLSSDKKERLGDAGRSATYGDEAEIHIVENQDGTWNLPVKLDSWWAAGLMFAANSFTASTPSGVALEEILNASKREDPRTIELLELAQNWALKQIDDIIKSVASQSPRRLANMLQSVTTELEVLADTHALLRSRYQADMEIMDPNP